MPMRPAIARRAALVAVLGASIGLGPAQSAQAAAPRIPMPCGHLQLSRWACRYNGPIGGADVAVDVAASPDGSAVYVTGSSAGYLSNDDFATAAYQAGTGQVLWTTRYDGSGFGDEATALTVAPDGSKVFVTGSSYVDGDSNMATVAYDAASGAQLWVALLPVAGGKAVDMSPDGSVVYVTGWSWDGLTKATTVAYDADSGGQAWVSSYSAGNFDEGTFVEASPEGSKVFVADLTIGSSSDIGAIGLDATDGHVLWASDYNDPDDGEDIAYGFAVSPDGSKVVVTGSDWSTNNATNFVTIAFDGSTGDQAWLARYTSRRYGSDQANAVAVSPDGSSVFVTGATWARQQVGYLTIAYDLATGGQRWLARYFNAYAIGTAIGVSPDGSRVYVSGEAGTPRYQYTTMAYNASAGERLWIARTDLDATDVVRGLAVDPDGSSVFVTGSFAPTGYDTNDYLTVAYPA
jgi:sugar lactone lactonase YvrE